MQSREERRGVIALALVAGVLLVGNLFADRDLLSSLGLIVLAGAVAGAAATLVRPTWLKWVAALGAVALLVAVREVLRDLTDRLTAEGVLGALTTLVVALVLLRGPRPARPGNHRS